jgi:hypothetical protein
MLDLLTQMNSSRGELVFNNEFDLRFDPMVIRPCSSDGKVDDDYLCIVMPMEIK